MALDKQEFLERYRHSLAHILAKAMVELYGPEVQYAIGPQMAVIMTLLCPSPCPRRILRLLRTR